MIISITRHSSSDSVNSAETSNVFFTLGAGESELNDALAARLRGRGGVEGLSGSFRYSVDAWNTCLCLRKNTLKHRMFNLKSSTCEWFEMNERRCTTCT